MGLQHFAELLDTQEVTGSSPVPPNVINDETISTCPSINIYFAPPIWREICSGVSLASVLFDLLPLSALSMSF